MTPRIHTVRIEGQLWHQCGWPQRSPQFNQMLVYGDQLTGQIQEGCYANR